MKRRLFNAGALLSLLVCVAVAVLWVRGIWFDDELEFKRQGRVYADIALGSGRPGLRLWVWLDAASPSDAEGPGESWKITVNTERYPSPRAWTWGTQSAWHRWGFWFISEGYRWTQHEWRQILLLGCPHWVVVTALSMLPLAWVLQWGRRRLLAARNACLACGYDLRGGASPTCPECGAEVPRPRGGGSSD